MTFNLMTAAKYYISPRSKRRKKSNKTKKVSNQPKMQMTASVLEEIKSTIGCLPHEQGGVLLGSLDDYIVTEFIFDRNARTSGGAYDPDLATLNSALEEAHERELHFLGFIHSHPPGCRRLSGYIDRKRGIGDLAYLEKLFESRPWVNKFLTPIVQVSTSGEMEIIPYIAEKGEVENYFEAKLEIVPDDVKEETRQHFTPDNSRLVGSIDVNLMKHSHVVCIGVGGANLIMEKLARCGAGMITAIDFDTVDASNLTTQGFYISDIGKPKVDALGEHIRNINPEIEYVGMQADFMTLSKGKLKKILKEADLLLMMTDDFHCQAFGNKKAIEYNIPAIFAMMYEKARAAEVTFTIPSVTPACHRCCVSSRYKAYEEGYKNDITSSGSTIFHTEYLNSKVGLLSLAILHRNVQSLEMSGWFGSKFDRNFIELRIHPDYGVDKGSFYYDTYKGNPRNIAFDSVWQKVEAETDESYDRNCPDCGGYGDLEFSSFMEQIDNSVDRAVNAFKRLFHIEDIKDYFSGAPPKDKVESEE